MRLKNKNLSKVNDIASRNSDMPKNILRQEKDNNLAKDVINCSNDFQMVAEDLRPPILRKIVREKLTAKDRELLKKVKKQDKQAA